MSFSCDSSLPTTVSSFEDAVRKAFRVYAKVGSESPETEAFFESKQPRTEAARTKLGLALLLCSAALQTTTNPPSISLPSASPGDCTIELTDHNCPCALRDFIHVWSQIVPTIRRLSLGQLNEVRHLLCGLPPLTAVRDPHLEGVASALDAVASAFSTWSTCRDLPVRSQASVRVHSSPPLLHASAISEDDLDSMPRKRRQLEQVQDSTRSSVFLPKSRKGRARKAPTVHKSADIDEESNQHYEPTPAPSGLEQKSRGSPQVKWGPVTYTYRSTRVLPPLPPGKRPAIWAASRNDLCTILPELGQAQDNIVLEGTETPTLFLDGPCGQLDRWEGGKTIYVSITRTFEYPITYTYIDNLCGRSMPTLPSQPMGVDAHQGPHEIPSIPYPAEAVLNEEGLYVFPHNPDGELATQPPPASHFSPASYGASTALGDVYTPSIEDAPTEIHALIRAQQSQVPFNVILCRGASLSAFALPEGCGCAYLGFFFVSEVVALKAACSWGENAEGPFVRGAVTWSFKLNWTPGGDDPAAPAVSSLVPWWMEDPPGPPTQGTDHAPSEDATMSDMDLSLRHPYTLLPLHFFAPPSQSGSGVTGWRCTSCGRLNVQRNLCVQMCAGCSTSNGLAPLAIEDVRQFRGTDPITFPWNRHGESVESSSSEAPEGLRRFTYKIADGAVVHHLFTRNHSAVQAQPTQLFHDLQAEVELEAKPVVKVARGAPSVSYSAQFGTRNASKGKGGNSSVWPSDVPVCISRARDLMLRRTRLGAALPALAINSLTVSSWRSAGNKTGLVLAAAQSPVVVLCLGADAELTFTGPRQAGACRAPAPKRKTSRLTCGTHDIEDDVDESDDVTDTAHGVVLVTRSTAKKTSKGHEDERTDAALMITLVHGDLLVVQGAAFEYSLKKTGMSILLLGSS